MRKVLFRHSFFFFFCCFERKKPEKRNKNKKHVNLVRFCFMHLVSRIDDKLRFIELLNAYDRILVCRFVADIRHTDPTLVLWVKFCGNRKTRQCFSYKCVHLLRSTPGRKKAFFAGERANTTFRFKMLPRTSTVQAIKNLFGQFYFHFWTQFQKYSQKYRYT